MKVLTVIGTRPEIIRLSRIIPKLDNILGINHILAHTGQNYDKNLNDIFFEELRLRQPNEYMNAKGSLAQQLGIIMIETEKIINKYKPDKMLILGDTNTDVSAFIAERMGIPVYHMEAGNRCFDLTVPEEVNRRMIDNICSINIPYTNRSRDNLIKIGFNLNDIYVSGNPIYEVLDYYKYDINKSSILKKLNLIKKEYILVTIHRQENVNNLVRFKEILKAFNEIAKDKPIIISTHPRTRDKLNKLQMVIHEDIKFLEPFGFFDFVKLEQEAECIITDSGTVQEEQCILQVPGIVIRRTTERPEAIECGASILAGIKKESILQSYYYALTKPSHWNLPQGYNDLNVSDKIVNLILNKPNNIK